MPCSGLLVATLLQMFIELGLHFREKLADIRGPVVFEVLGALIELPHEFRRELVALVWTRIWTGDETDPGHAMVLAHDRAIVHSL